MAYANRVEDQQLEELLPRVLLDAADQARLAGLPYRGTVSPEQAWSLVQDDQAILVDVRTAEERKFVGHVRESIHVAWQIGPALLKNPRFLRELESRAGKSKPILLLCRSGKRSAAAAEAALKAGFQNVFNVKEGFEGDLDAQQQRGVENGWRYRGLPWVQD